MMSVVFKIILQLNSITLMSDLRCYEILGLDQYIQAHSSVDFEQLERLRERNTTHYAAVARVFNILHNKYATIVLPRYYLIDKRDVAFVFRFEYAAFHVQFNVVLDDEPLDSITDVIEYSVQIFVRNSTNIVRNSTPISVLKQYDNVEDAIRYLITQIL